MDSCKYSFGPDVCAINRIEYHYRKSDEILYRDITNRRHHAAVLRIIAIVSQSKVMCFWHFVDRSVVEWTVIADLYDPVFKARFTGAARQGLDVLMHQNDRPALPIHVILDRPPLHY